MAVSIPSISIDPAAIRAAATELPRAGLAQTRQAEVIVRTWIGLADVYEAPESPVLVSALDPVRENAIRSGQGEGATVPTGDRAVPATLTAVTLEGGRPGYAADVDFKQPAAGRGTNAFDGSVGRATAYFDADGNFVGLSDLYDFSNRGPDVDLVNLAGGLSDAQPFVVRGGVIEEQPEIPGAWCPMRAAPWSSWCSGTAASILDRMR